MNASLRLYKIVLVAIGVSAILSNAAVVLLWQDGVSHGRQTRAVSVQSCNGVHKIVTAGAAILDSEAQLQYALKHHLITHSQYTVQQARLDAFRPLTQRELRIWRSADCAVGH